MPTAAPEAGETGPDSKDRESGGAAIRLGQTGYLRFQKFVEVIYTPVISAVNPDPTAPGAASITAAAEPPAEDFDFYSDVEAELTVDGVDAALVSEEPARADDDPLFEDTYRSAFVNYEEGRHFRLREKAIAAGPPNATTALTRGLNESALSDFSLAATAMYRVFVKTNGIYRLTWSYLLDPTTGVAPGLSGTLPSAFKMTNKGVEIPIRVVDGGDGSFGPGDYIEFYGEGMLNEPKLILNYHYDPNINPGVDDILQANDFTDENVYFLFGEAGSHARIPNLAASFTGGTPETAFLDTLHNEFDTVFVPEGKNDPFYETPSLLTSANAFNPDPNAVNCGYANTNGVHKLSNYMGPGTDPNFISVSCPACALSLTTPDPNSTSFTATVRARMRGSSLEAANPDHMTVLQVGTTTPSARSSSMCWDQETVVVQSVNVPQSALTAGPGPGVYIGQPGLTTTASAEAFFLDWIEVDYRRALKLSTGALASHFPNAARSYEMGGFPSGSTAADQIIYDISRSVTGSTVASPRLITGASVQSDGAGGLSLKYTLPLDTGLGAGVQQRFAAATTGGYKTPLRVTEVSGDNLRLASNGADMIVITTPGIVGAPAVTQFTDYLNHRATASNLRVKVAMMRDIYDQFSDGLETPDAIKAFLAYAVATWTPPAPAYVLLVGDSSVDYKNLTNQANWVNDVPTYIMYQRGPFLDYYASDTWIAAILGSDQLPDVHLGRITVRTPAETSTVFQKLLDYDLNPPTGSWRSRGLFLADTGKPNTGETLEFIGLQDGVANTYFTAPFTNQKLYYANPPYNGSSSDPNSRHPDLWRTDYSAASSGAGASGGAALTSYVGHGSFDDWGGVDTLFNSAFLATFPQNQKPTVLVNEDCLVGGFHSRSFDSLGENFIKMQGKGAVAVFAPAGLSFSTVFGQINNVLFGEMFGLTKERRFGNLITDTRVGLSFSITDMQAYVLLGDPSQRIILPAPRPPVGFAAGNGQDARVTLSWSPSPDPGVLTRIYRREMFDSTYVLLNPSGASGTSYVDTNVVNGSPYFYRAVSLDPNGPFEGAVTNLNTTCNFLAPASGSGSDCVWAVPLNPNPPAMPVNFKVVNPGTGDRLRVSWNATAEPDIRNYTVYYGTTPGGPYTGNVSITAPATGGEVAGLATGTAYYLVATATNTSNRTSVPTPEGSGVPGVFEGITPPDFITDLQVLRSVPSPSSIELRWTPPPTDIYGGPTSLQSFAIYRGTNPVFVPAPANKIATINNPSTSVYTDPNAFSAPQNFYYLIASSDTSGFPSGVGLQLPNGIVDLALSVSGGNLVMNWTPVVFDIDGNPTLIEHYELYSDSQPVGRARIGTLTPANPFITGGSLSMPMPAGTMVYFSLISVDVKQNKSPF